MSNNNNQDSSNQGGPAKRGLPRLVLVAVGAALGGVGVVFAVPPKKVVVEVPEKAHEYVLCDSTEPMCFTVNPNSNRGKAVVVIKFGFQYKVREDRESHASEFVKVNWAKAESNVLLLLRGRDAAEFRDPNFDVTLQRDIQEELNNILFPGSKDEKIATVVGIDFREFQVH